MQIYADQQQFDKGIALCDEIIAYLKRNPFHIKDKAHQDSEIKETEKIKTSFVDWEKNEARRKLVRIKSNNGQGIPFNNDSILILFDAEYNGHRVKTVFDTGLSFYFFLGKGLADKIGVKYRSGQDSTKLFNNKRIKALEGIIDSVCIGNVKLYNIPVMSYLETPTVMIPDSIMNIPEKKSKIENALKNALNSSQIIIGLPTMLLIGQFEFDWLNHTLTFPNKILRKKTEPSIFLRDDGFLYTKLYINDLMFTGLVDTGAGLFVNINNSFYEKNKKTILLDSIAPKKPIGYAGITRVQLNLPYEIVKDAKIRLNDACVSHNPNEVIVEKSDQEELYAGFTGLYFFQHLGSKTLFDFRNMRIEGKGKPIKKKGLSK